MHINMPVYSFTLKKYMKSKSTWIITFFSAIIIAFCLGTWLPLGLMKKDINAPNYAVSINLIVSMIMTFLALFSAIFAGFKAASMYKDEVEEGTFLVVLSKPITRSNVIFQKYLALFTLLFFYAIINALFFVIGVALFDKGGKEIVLQNGFESLRSRVGLVGVYIFLILFVVGLIFASIGIIISTKLSVSATIGIAVALGIVIPITGIVKAFTHRAEQKSIANPQFAVNAEMLRLAANIPGVDVSAFDDLQKDVEAYKIYDLATSTKDKDLFKMFWWVDISYQVNNMATLATDATLSDTAKQLVNAAQADKNQDKKYSEIETKEIDSAFTIVKTLMDDFNKPSVTSKLTPRDIGAKLASIKLINAFNQLPVERDKNKAIISKPIFQKLVAASQDQTMTSFPALDDFVKKVNDHQTAPGGSAQMTAAEFDDLINGLFDFNGSYHFTDALSNTVAAQSSDTKQKITYDAIFKEGGLLDSLASSSTAFETAANTFHDEIKNQESPLTGLLFSKDNVMSLKLQANQKYNDWYSEDANSKAFDALSDNMSIDDQSFARNLLIAASQDNLKVVSGKPYVAPGALLGIYALIALILVPSTYLVIRRQDFR